MPQGDVPEKLKPLLDVLVTLPHFRELGVTAERVERGFAIVRSDYDERTIGNPETGVIHGGVVTTVMDSVCGLVAFTVLEEPKPIATLDLRIDYLKPATPGKALRGQAEVYKETRNVTFVRGVAYHDDPDDPIANCTATFMIGSVGFKVGGEGGA
ncbi:MAG: PaaI family thioesterase [Rhodospirillales bacterium]|nr:PaaI family thioesterase [Rhodospirillales bacterium]MCW8861782.1 PaaI family thioesterase [Rhodospirillales bacterium]MCW8951536.1 PaaI family thioesterase [Rhodospirillales bacterium]MCW8969790.1 PaaI family thioesterase [Rhodospirillales bacterium]MCW9001710.1 PaaI family thioesterase [Rhodospirillales bacterium]